MSLVIALMDEFDYPHEADDLIRLVREQGSSQLNALFFHQLPGSLQMKITHISSWSIIGY